jgi:ParE-like toxin of type II ParDE toxin-antitoxin system
MWRLEFTPRARRDIEEIWEYSFERFGLDKAEAYLREIQRAAMTVAETRAGDLRATRFAPAIASSLSALILPSVGDPRRHCPNSRWADELRSASPLTPQWCRARQLGL